jgi:hypothetical protein
MDSDSVRGINRRRLLGWGGLAAGVAVGASLADAQPSHAASAPTDPATSGDDRIPPDTLPGGAYDRYVAELAAKGEFSGVVLLSHQGRTVLSRSYGMADNEKGSWWPPPALPPATKEPTLPFPPRSLRPCPA